MEFERAKFELRTQDHIREEKPKISGSIKKELQELIDTGFKRLKHLRETEEGRKNESVILELAEKLNIDREELIEEFEKGLRFNIKAGYKTKLIDRQSRNEDIDTIVGAYTLSFRQALNWFKREKKEDSGETPKNILEITKRMYLLSPKVIKNLRDKYKDNPDVSEGVIKHFVIHNPRSPKEAIENALIQIKELKLKFPKVDEGMIKYFAFRYPKNPKQAIENALRQIEDLKNEYKDNPDVDKHVIKYFVTNNPEDPKKAIENALIQIKELKLKFPKIDEWMIKHFVIHNPRGSEEAIENALIQIKELKLKFPKVDEGMIKYFAVRYPKNPGKAIEDALERIEYFKNEYKDRPEVSGQMIEHFVIYNVRRSKKAIEDIKRGKKEEVLRQIRELGDDEYSKEDLLDKD